MFDWHENKLIIVIEIIAIVLIFFIIKRMRSKYRTMIIIKSIVDGNDYAVVNKSLYKSQDSANTLAIINERIMKLIEYLETEYAGSGSTIENFVTRLKSRYSKDIISEAISDPRYTTYTVDKKDIHVCLRTRDSNDLLYDINTLMYVVLHELAHLCNFDSNGEMIIGHGPEFMFIFRTLVISAIKAGVYTKVDYTKTPKEYCGMMINSSIV